jgi:FkbM family methyltransferase
MAGNSERRRLATRVARMVWRLYRRVGRPFRLCRPLARLAFPSPASGWGWFRNSFGYEMRLTPFYHIDRHIIALGCYEPETHRVIAERVRPGMVVFDVGANIGEMTLHMARQAAPTGHVYAFEPIPFLYARIHENLARNHLAGVVTVVDAVLAAMGGSATLFATHEQNENHGTSSLARLVPSQTPVTVAAFALDDFASARKLARLDFMKFDIQGGEWAALQGARRTLNRFHPQLLVEVSPEDLQAIGHTSTELCLLLEQLGYRLYTLDGRTIRAEDVAPDFHSDALLCV